MFFYSPFAEERWIFFDPVKNAKYVAAQGYGVQVCDATTVDKRATVGNTIMDFYKELSIKKRAACLVMTSLAFSSTDICNRYAIHFVVLEVIMEFFINTVKFISRAVIIIKVHFGFTMTIDTPAHA